MGTEVLYMWFLVILNFLNKFQDHHFKRPFKRNINKKNTQILNICCIFKKISYSYAKIIFFGSGYYFLTKFKRRNEAFAKTSIRNLRKMIRSEVIKKKIT